MDGTDQAVEHFDVLVIGAGISGIDAGRHLTERHPDKSFALLERKESFGGTWHTHRFPGIRSDSDLYTFGFSWKPWKGAEIGTAEEILSYLGEAIEEAGLEDKIRYGVHVSSASWDSARALWLLDVVDGGVARQLSCGFLWFCGGYFDHDKGYQPDWPGMETFDGPIVHPQHWPEDLDYAGKRVVVIGSGATAATLIPALAGTAAHVTMLQRSPTYFYPRPKSDEFNDILRELDLPDAQFHDIMRRKMLHMVKTMTTRSKEEPEVLAREFVMGARAYLGRDFDVKTHFTPSYRPWQQRVAAIPDGDLSQAIRRGEASVVTDEIARFVPGGIELRSGEVLEADIVVSATGLNLVALGGIALEVDGLAVNPAECVTQRGVMLSGVPNLGVVVGYLRSSWTVRADLGSAVLCRLFDHMAARQARMVVPEYREAEGGLRPWIDPENFNAGYIMRAHAVMPKQGAAEPWVMSQDYFADREMLPMVDFDDGSLVFR
ncbi:MAG: flavin-containing monooxygenase [Paracoccaceae bacterium]